MNRCPESTVRRYLAFAVAAALLILSPGLEPYRAWAQLNTGMPAAPSGSAPVIVPLQASPGANGQSQAGAASFTASRARFNSLPLRFRSLRLAKPAVGTEAPIPTPQAASPVPRSTVEPVETLARELAGYDSQPPAAGAGALQKFWDRLRSPLDGLRARAGNGVAPQRAESRGNPLVEARRLARVLRQPDSFYGSPSQVARLADLVVENPQIKGLNDFVARTLAGELRRDRYTPYKYTVVERLRDLALRTQFPAVRAAVVAALSGQIHPVSDGAYGVHVVENLRRIGVSSADAQIQSAVVTGILASLNPYRPPGGYYFFQAVDPAEEVAFRSRHRVVKETTLTLLRAEIGRNQADWYARRLLDAINRITATLPRRGAYNGVAAGASGDPALYPVVFFESAQHALTGLRKAALSFAVENNTPETFAAFMADEVSKQKGWIRLRAQDIGDPLEVKTEHAVADRFLPLVERAIESGFGASTQEFRDRAVGTLDRILTILQTAGSAESALDQLESAYPADRLPAELEKAVMALDKQRHRPGLPDLFFRRPLEFRRNRVTGSWWIVVASFPTSIAGPRPDAKPFDLETYVYSDGRIVRAEGGDRGLPPTTRPAVAPDPRVHDAAAALNQEWSDENIQNGSVRAVAGKLNLAPGDSITDQMQLAAAALLNDGLSREGLPIGEPLLADSARPVTRALERAARSIVAEGFLYPPTQENIRPKLQQVTDAVSRLGNLGRVRAVAVSRPTRHPGLSGDLRARVFLFLNRSTGFYVAFYVREGRL